MDVVIFLLIGIGVLFLLAMRRAPLWAWSAGIAVLVLAWQWGFFQGAATAPELTLWKALAWLPVIALAALSVPGVRKTAITGPAYDTVRKILPKVSDTEQQALEAGTIGFDAELFSGKPDWGPTARRCPCDADQRGARLPRRPDRRTLPHDRRLADPPWGKGDPRADLGFRQTPRFPRDVDIEGAWRPRIFGAGPVADPGQDFFTFARRRYDRHGTELAGTG